jgi:hypothetical protein
MPPSVNHYAKGDYLIGGGPPMERPRPQTDEFDAHVQRANEYLDKLIALRAKAKATKEYRDFMWRIRPW